MPATLLRFTSSAARNETRGILYNTKSTDRGWIGGVGEIIGLSTISSTSERQKIESYLAHKWGLTGSLAPLHPYRNTPALSWNSTLQTEKSLEASATQVGTGKEGFYGTTISGLTAGETYHYRIRSQGKQNPKGISAPAFNYGSMPRTVPPLVIHPMLSQHGRIRVGTDIMPPHPQAHQH